jgi:circadian clock protein KaiC
MSPEETANSARPKINTGVSGLDEILYGGFPANRLYLLQGEPGTGKTTLALQFLLEGRARGEHCLYVTLSETKDELGDVAESHGWSLQGIDLYELESTAQRLKPEEEYTVFRPEDVELADTMREVYEYVERVRPSRVVFDSLSEMRLLARDPLRYRRQILTLKQFFTGRKCTVLLLDDMTGTDHDLQLQSISHGVVILGRLGREYGISRRQLNVLKLRGSPFQDGYHDYVIVRGGLVVFPRLVAAVHRGSQERSTFPSGIPELDGQLGGGLHRGTNTLISGPAGSGKSTITALYLRAAAERGEHAVAYLFEESPGILLDRMAALNLDLRPHVASGVVRIQQIDPAELCPGQFVHQLTKDVEEAKARVVVIDSVNGYLNAMPNERFLLAQLHELLSYLSEMGVVSVLVMAQHGFVGPAMQSPVDVSYLVDTLILLRFFEFGGAVKRAISVVKHREGSHEDTIRELRLGAAGIQIGPPLRDFRGVLTGLPFYDGQASSLLEQSDDK